jgi:hypothetical protein
MSTVYVYEWDYPSDTTGALSALTDDDLVTAFPNPLTTDEFGEFYFNTTNGLKLLEYHYGGKLMYREQAILTPAGVYPGNDATLRADLAALGGAALVALTSGGTVDDASFQKGPAAAVAGTTFSIDWRAGDGAADAPSLGGFWPLGSGHVGRTRERRFTAVNAPGAANTAPCVAGLDYAEAAGTLQDVVAHMAFAYATANNSVIFAGNDLATGGAGRTGIRYVIREGDAQAAAGTTPASGCIGQALNFFSVAYPGNAGQVNCLSGGSISNGYVIYGPVTGAAFAGGSGGNLGSLTNTGACTYLNNVAHVISNGHKTQNNGTASTHWLTYSHSNDDFRIKFGAGLFVLRNAADAANVLAVNAGGALALGANASTSAGYKLDVASDVTTEAGGLADFKNSAGLIAAEILIATGTNGNAAACAVRLRANSVTSRSINAGGTINASGADYAEYERKADGIDDFVKGAVVGFKPDGLLTDRFADSVRFGVKSTNPNLVGGDDWAGHLPAAPVPPTFEPPPYEGIEDPGPTWAISDATDDEIATRAAVVVAKQTNDLDAFSAATEALRTLREERAARDASLYAEWEAAQAQRKTDVAAHDKAIEKARAKWEATTWAEYEAALSSYNELLDEARQPFDRIAYCGKVPLNLTGATPGQWVIVSASGSGGIEPLALDYAATTQEQRDRFCIGTVNRILDDGRAEIVVRV